MIAAAPNSPWVTYNRRVLLVALITTWFAALLPQAVAQAEPGRTKTQIKLELSAADKRAEMAAEWIDRSPDHWHDPETYLEPPRPLTVEKLGTIAAKRAKVTCLAPSFLGRVLALGLEDGSVEFQRLDKPANIGRVAASRDPVRQITFSIPLTYVMWLAGNRVFYCEFKPAAVVQEITIPGAEVQQCGFVFNGSEGFVAIRTPGSESLGLVRFSLLGSKVELQPTTLPIADGPYAMTMGNDAVYLAGNRTAYIARLRELERRPATYLAAESAAQAIEIRDRRLFVISRANGVVESLKFNEEMSHAATRLDTHRKVETGIAPAACMAALLDFAGLEIAFVYGGGECLEIWDLYGGESLGKCGGPPPSPMPVRAISPLSGMVFSVDAQNAVQIYALPRPHSSKTYLYDHFVAGVRGLLVQEKFARLDEVYAARRAAIEQPGANGLLLGAFWEGLAGAGSSTQPRQDIDVRIDLMQKYLKSRPKSIVPHVVLAQLYDVLGEQARGGARAANVTEAQWAQMAKWHRMAATSIKVALEIGDDPQIGATTLSLLRHTQVEADVLDRILKRNGNLGLGYPKFCYELATYLLPRWGGEPGEVGSRAAKLADGCEDQLLGDRVYVSMARIVIQMEQGRSLADSGFDYARLKASTARLMERYPEWDPVLRVRVEAALLEKDPDEAKWILEHAAGQLSTSYWGVSEATPALKRLAEGR